MIAATSESEPFLTTFSNGKLSAHADTTVDKGGGEAGFRPHELLEAALASCMNIHLRMYASSHGINLGSVGVRVSLDRSSSSEAIFKFSLDLPGVDDATQRRKLLHIAQTCPVHQTLLRKISFQVSTEGEKARRNKPDE